MFRETFKNVQTNHYHFMQLQMVRKAKNERTQEFADGGRGFAQKVMCKSNYPMAQRFHREKAQQMPLASFAVELTGVPGQQGRYANPRACKKR